MILGIWAWGQEFKFSLMSEGLNLSFEAIYFIMNISYQSFQLQIKNKVEGVVHRCDEGEECSPARYLENGKICIESILLVVKNND